MNDYNLVISQTEPTHYPTQPNHRESTIDLVFNTPQSSKFIKVEVLDELNGSHRPLRITYATKMPHRPNPPKRIYWRLKTASPEKFKNTLEQTFQNFVDEFKNEAPEDTLNELTQRMLNVAKITVGKSKPRGEAESKPWWNQTIATLIKQKNRARRKSQRQRTRENRALYDALQKRTKAAIRAAKAQYWHRQYKRLAEKSSSAVWAHFKRATNQLPAPSPITIQNPTGELTNDPKATTNLISKAFSEISTEQNPANDAAHHKMVNAYLHSNQSDFQPNTNPNEHYNQKFNTKELEYAINQAKDGAPGHDEVHYWFLRNSGVNFRNAFLHAINKFWDNGTMPKKWKIAHIIPIPKFGKDTTIPTNYRPISLLSCAGKTMERMIHNRLYWQAETNGWLSPQQSAFRRGRSTTDPLLNLIEDTQEAFSRREEVLAVFLDLQKAYDKVWHDGLIYKLHRKGIRGRMLHFINDFLRQRICMVKINGQLSVPYTPRLRSEHPSVQPLCG